MNNDVRGDLLSSSKQPANIINQHYRTNSNVRREEGYKINEYSTILPSIKHIYANEDGSNSTSQMERGPNYVNESLTNFCSSCRFLWIKIYQASASLVYNISANLRICVDIVWYRSIVRVSTKGPSGTNTVARCDLSLIFAFIVVVLCCSGERVFYKQSVDQLLNSLQFVLIQLMLLGSCAIFTIITIHQLAAGEIS